MQTYWFVTLISAVCLEGLGRRYLPFIPSAAFYLLKDVVLIFGYVRFRPPLPVRRTDEASLSADLKSFWPSASFGPLLRSSIRIRSL